MKGPIMHKKQAAIKEFRERIDILYNGRCQEAENLLNEMEFNVHLSTKFIKLVSDAMWELR